MSGEAGWVIRRDLYSLFVGSGRTVSVAVQPGGATVGEYFARENEPYRRWLERAQPRLDELFTRLVAEGLPLVGGDAKTSEIDGIVIEEPDEKAAHFRKHSRGLPCPVHLRSTIKRTGGSVNLRVVVSRRVRRAELDPVIAQVLTILEETETEPAAPPLAPAPADDGPRAAPSLGARVTAWLRRLVSRG